jgi:hypothetical protein
LLEEFWRELVWDRTKARYSKLIRLTGFSALVLGYE